MLCLLVAVTVVALCSSYPYHGTTEYVCKDDVTSVQYSHRRSMSPYMISVKQQNTHNLLVTISSKQLIPFTDFTIKSLYYPTSSKKQQAQFVLVDDEGLPLSQCQGGKIRYKATLLWTTEDYVTENIKFEANIWYNSTTFWTSEETVKLSTVRDYIPPDPWCGKTKGCFLNCTTTDCDYIVSWAHDADTVTFDIQTKVTSGTVINSWAAIGLSFDQRMTGSSIIMCMSDFGLLRAELGFTNGHTYSKIDDLKSSLTFINGSIEDNILRCRVKREIQSTGDMIYDLRDNWYFLFAHGKLSEGFPMYHDFRIASMGPFNFLAPLAKQTSIQSVQNGSIPPDPACGKTKACFTNCTDTDCEYLISWSHDDKSVSFDMQTKVQAGTTMNSWVAIGLSSNQSMAGSSIMMCLNEDGKMTAEFGFTEGHAYSKLNDTQHTLTLLSGSTEDSVFHCTVQRDIDLSTNEIFGLRNEWYFMFAFGNVSKGVPLHHLNKTVSTSVIDFLAAYEDPMASLTVDGDGIPPDPACGKTKACFTNCTDTDCEYIVSWTHDDKTITFDIQSKVMTGSIMNSWAAIGLTAYPSMPGSSVMMCLVSDGKMSAEFGYNPGYIYNKSNDTQHTLSLVNGSMNSNIFRCTVKRDIDVSTDKIFSLQKKWYLLFANGNVNQGIPMEHSNKTMSKSAIDFLAPMENRQDSRNYYSPVELYDMNVADSNQVPTITLDSGCNVSKSCFHDCNPNGCNYLVSWSNDGNDVTFNITTKMTSDTINNGWVAVGFSPTGKMDFSSTMMCLHENGTFHGQYGYTRKYHQYNPIENGTIPIISSFTDGNIFHCSIQRPTISTIDKIFNLTEKWHMIFAHGEISLRGRHVPKYHNFRVEGTTKLDFLATPTFSQNKNTETTTTKIETVTSNSPPVITPDADCGVTKGCFHDCSNTACNYLVTWTNDASQLTVNIAGKINTGNVDTAWVGVGFSPNGKMSSSSFILCMNANGVFYGQYGYSPPYTKYIPVDNKTVPVTESSTSGNVIRCTLKRPIISDSDKIFNLTQQWHILYAYGSVSAVSGGTPIASYHDFKVGGNNSINFIRSNTISTTARPDTTDNVSTTTSIETTSGPGTITPDNGCGVTKTCFHDCSSSECSYLISWTNDTNDVTFSIAAKVTTGDPNIAWVAVGFSPDGKMPLSSTIMCMNAKGTVYGHYGYTTNYTQYVEVENGTIPITESSTIGNIVRCTIKRPIVSSSKRIFNLTQQWHILFAHGENTLSQSGSPYPNFHDFKIGGTYKIDFLKVSSEPTTVIPDSTTPNTDATTASSETTVTSSPGTITLDPECGKTKGCFPQCSGTSCTSLVTWQKDNDVIKFEVAEDISNSITDRWIAIGFSPNQNMGGTSVVMCQSKSNGDKSVDIGYNDGLVFSPMNAPHMISNQSMAVHGQVMRCNFKRVMSSSNPKIFDLSSNWYILLGNGPIIGGIPQKHENTPISTSSVVDFTKFSMVHGGIQTSLIIKIHGSLMAVAWIMFSSIGIILARYFKKHWSDSTWMKQKIWFQIHRTCMVLTVLCTMGGFILMMVENKGYRELTETGEKSYVNYHPIFGIIVFGLTLLNPIIAMFRCAPDHDNRPIFNWMHSIVGTSAHILGAITVGFGLNIPKAGVHSDVNYVIIAYAISFVVIEFLLIQLSKHSNMPDQKVFNLSGNDEDTPSRDSPAMKFVLFLHFVAMITCCALIVYMVIES